MRSKATARDVPTIGKWCTKMAHKHRKMIPNKHTLHTAFKLLNYFESSTTQGHLGIRFLRWWDRERKSEERRLMSEVQMQRHSDCISKLVNNIYLSISSSSSASLTRDLKALQVAYDFDHNINIVLGINVQHYSPPLSTIFRVPTRYNLHFSITASIWNAALSLQSCQSHRQFVRHFPRPIVGVSHLSNM